MERIELSEEHVNSLVQADRDLGELLPYYDKLEECGVNCTAWREINLDKRNQISKLREHFAPTRQMT